MVCEAPKNFRKPRRSVVFLAAAMVFGFLFSGVSGADEMKKLPTHTFGIGTEVFHYHYYQTYNTINIMTEEGVMAGVTTHYTYHGDNKLMLRPEFKADWGSVDYTSDFTSSRDPIPGGSINNIPDYIIETRLLIGYDYYMPKTTIVLTPYTGFGYRFLHDGGGGKISSTDGKASNQESNYYYSPFGLELVNDLKNGWILGGTAEFDYLWKGKQRNELSSMAGFSDLNDLTSDQDRGYGIRLSIMATKKSKMFDFSVEPFFRYWRIEKGTDGSLIRGGVLIPGGEITEPLNQTDEIGVNFTFSY
jgi:hypothetical protein